MTKREVDSRMITSLRTRMMLEIMGFLILPLVIIGALMAVNSFRVQQEHAIEHQTDIASHAAHEVENFILGLESNLRMVIQVQDVFDIELEQLHTTLSTLVAYRDAFEEVSLIDAAGLEVDKVSRSTSSDEFQLGDLSETDEFLVPKKTAQTYFGPVSFDPVSGEPKILINVPVLEAQNEVFEGLLRAKLNLKPIGELIPYIHPAESGHIYILSQDGQVIAHRNPALVLRGTTFPAPERNGFQTGIGGGLVMLAVEEVRLGQQTLFVVAELPWQEAMNLTIRNVLAISSMTLFAVLTTFMLGLLVMRRVVQPVETLAAKARAIAEGDLLQRVEVDAADEIGSLALSFNRMASELQNLVGSLEERVDERTKALQDAQKATLSMMEDVEEARRKAETANEELRAAQVATMNIMMDVEEARKKAEKANVELTKEVAERIRAEESLLLEKRFTDHVINSIPGVFYVFDDNGKFLRWNDNFSRVTEYSDDEIAQMPPTQLFTGEDQDYIAARIQLVLYTGYANAEADFTTKSGHKIPYYFTGYRTFADRTPIVIGTGFDITERKQAEEALAQKAAELERSNQELEQFAYVASHDLQEPLRMVASYLQLLERRYGDQLDGDAREFIDYAVDGATRMKRLINDLLAYSRVGTKGKPFEDIDLNRVLRQALANLKRAIDESQASIFHDNLPTVWADETQLIQVFQNLIGNAIKFRKPDEVPRIHIRTERVEDGWQIAIQDNGIGFDSRFAERIFVIFQRLHHKDEYSGTGIGLSISKRIVERHGGRIWAESTLGVGSSFYFTLPHTKEEAE